MRIYIELVESIFDLDCVDYRFRGADAISNGTHLEVRDETSRQLMFKCRLDNIDSLVKFDED